MFYMSSLSSLIVLRKKWKIDNIAARYKNMRKGGVPISINNMPGGKDVRGVIVEQLQKIGNSSNMRSLILSDKEFRQKGQELIKATIIRRLENTSIFDFIDHCIKHAADIHLHNNEGNTSQTLKKVSITPSITQQSEFNIKHDNPFQMIIQSGQRERTWEFCVKLSGNASQGPPMLNEMFTIQYKSSQFLSGSTIKSGLMNFFKTNPQRTSTTQRVLDENSAMMLNYVNRLLDCYDSFCKGLQFKFDSLVVDADVKVTIGFSSSLTRDDIEYPVFLYDGIKTIDMDLDVNHAYKILTGTVLDDLQINTNHQSDRTQKEKGPTYLAEFLKIMSRKHPIQGRNPPSNDQGKLKHYMMEAMARMTYDKVMKELARWIILNRTTGYGAENTLLTILTNQQIISNEKEVKKFKKQMKTRIINKQKGFNEALLNTLKIENYAPKLPSALLQAMKKTPLASMLPGPKGKGARRVGYSTLMGNKPWLGLIGN